MHRTVRADISPTAPTHMLLAQMAHDDRRHGPSLATAVGGLIIHERRRERSEKRMEVHTWPGKRERHHTPTGRVCTLPELSHDACWIGA
jgi:hypothetical protein